MADTGFDFWVFVLSLCTVGLPHVKVVIFRKECQLEESGTTHHDGPLVSVLSRRFVPRQRFPPLHGIP